MKAIDLSEQFQKIIDSVTAGSLMVKGVLALALVVFAVFFVIDIVKQAHAFLTAGEESEEKFDPEKWRARVMKFRRQEREWNDYLDERYEQGDR